MLGLALTAVAAAGAGWLAWGWIKAWRVISCAPYSASSLTVKLTHADGRWISTGAVMAGVDEDGLVVFEALSPWPLEEIAMMNVDVLPARSSLVIDYRP